MENVLSEVFLAIQNFFHCSFPSVKKFAKVGCHFAEVKKDKNNLRIAEKRAKESRKRGSEHFLYLEKVECDAL